MAAALKDAKDPHVAKAFEKWFNETLEAVKNNPHYKRIPLDKKPDQEWFLNQLFMTWDKKISKEEFVQNVEKKFPGYRTSAEFLTKHMPN